MINGHSLNLIFLKGSDFILDAGTVAFYLAINSDLRAAARNRMR